MSARLTSRHRTRSRVLSAAILVACALVPELVAGSGAAEGSMAAQATTIVSARADTTLSQGTPRRSLGNRLRLVADSTRPDRRVSLVRFRVPAPDPGELTTSAVLMVYADVAGAGVRAHRVGSAWSERSTWRSRPRVGTAVTAPSPRYARRTWVRLDVSPALSSSLRSRGGVLDLALTGSGRNALAFFSSETSLQPRLLLGHRGTGSIGSSAGGLTSPPSAGSSGTAVPPPPSSDRVPAGVAGSWQLVFDDEFDGDSLDLGKWRPNWLSSSDAGITKPVNSSELSCYDPREVSVSAGALSLRTEQRPCTAGNGVTYAYSSGLVESRHDFTYTYGYAEARMYLPANSDASKGTVGGCGPNWPAFWVNGYASTVGEIDVMECLGDDTQWTYHWDGYNRSATAIPQGWAGSMPASTDGWHTFGVNWQPGLLEFFYDGKLAGRQTVGVPSDPHYLIANLAVSGSRITAPQTVKVDYIRVWK